jgi:uncharacterized phage protein (TIGR01671 family)
MRDIKFRAWYDLKKQLFNVAEMGFRHSMVDLVLDGRVLTIPKSRIIIEQYTELKDMHKKEIYEGDKLGVLLDCDVCECEVCECGWQKDNKMIGVVKYKDGSFVLEYDGGISDPLSEFAYGAYTQGVLDYVEIVGNIHE